MVTECGSCKGTGMNQDGSTCQTCKGSGSLGEPWSILLQLFLLLAG